MENMFLTSDEVAELTGSRRKAGQIEALKRNGIRHTIKRNGWPCVAAANVIGIGPAQAEKPEWAPRKAG